MIEPPWFAVGRWLLAAVPAASAVNGQLRTANDEVVLYASRGSEILAKIAIELERALDARRIAGEPGQATSTTLAEGDGWRVADVICTSGPDDRPFEERHS